MFNLGAPELILILIIALLVFGPGKLPEIGGALGKGIREFRKASTELTDTFTKEVQETKEAIEGESASSSTVDEKKG